MTYLVGKVSASDIDVGAYIFIQGPGKFPMKLVCQIAHCYSAAEYNNDAGDEEWVRLRPKGYVKLCKRGMEHVVTLCYPMHSFLYLTVLHG